MLLREAEATHRDSRHQRRLVLRRAHKAGQHASVRRTRRHGIPTKGAVDTLAKHFASVLSARHPSQLRSLKAKRPRSTSSIGFKANTSPILKLFVPKSAMT